MLTIAHFEPHCTPEQLGFTLAEPRPSLESPEERTSGVADPDPRGSAKAPHAPEAAEPRPSERHAVVVPRDSVSTDGAVVDATSGTAVLKAACTSLGLKTSGNRKQLWNRLRDQVLRDEIQASSLVRHKLEQDVTRKAAAPSVAVTPNLEERARHNLVHEPYGSLVSALRLAPRAPRRTPRGRAHPVSRDRSQPGLRLRVPSHR